MTSTQLMANIGTSICEHVMAMRTPTSRWSKLSLNTIHHSFGRYHPMDTPRRNVHLRALTDCHIAFTNIWFTYQNPESSLRNYKSTYNPDKIDFLKVFKNQYNKSIHRALFISIHPFLQEIDFWAQDSLVQIPTPSPFNHGQACLNAVWFVAHRRSSPHFPGPRPNSPEQQQRKTAKEMAQKSSQRGEWCLLRGYIFRSVKR